MELSPTLLSRPFMFAQTLCNRDQTNSLLRGCINSESTHKLARDVEEAVELDDEHVKIGRTNIESMVCSKVVRQAQQDRLQKKRKNSSGEVGPSSPSTEKNGAVSGKKPKVHFNNALALAVGETVSRNAYQEKKKKKKTKSPNSNNHKHNYRSGAEKNHQQNRLSKK